MASRRPHKDHEIKTDRPDLLVRKGGPRGIEPRTRGLSDDHGVRRHLVEAGIVTETGVGLGRDRCTAGVGDVVQARRIDRSLGLTNRENYRVEAVRDDGGLDVVSTRTGEPRTMPPEYVSTDAALAYAGTVHATQGATVDAGHVVLTPGMSTAAAYVGLTRGRHTNTAWAVTDSGIPNTPRGTARGLLASIARGETDARDLSAHDIAAADEQWRGSAETLLALTEDHARIACRQRLDTDLDQLVADGHLPEQQRARFGSDQGSDDPVQVLQARYGLDRPGRPPRTGATPGPLNPLDAKGTTAMNENQNEQPGEIGVGEWGVLRFATREEWLVAAIDAIRPWFTDIGVDPAQGERLAAALKESEPKTSASQLLRRRRHATRSMNRSGRSSRAIGTPSSAPSPR
jgi:hypothetical protein